MADPSSHEEGDIKIIEPTLNVKKIISTLEIRMHTVEPLLKNVLKAIYEASQFQIAHCKLQTPHYCCQCLCIFFEMMSI